MSLFGRKDFAIDDIHAAFSPAQAIDEPIRFVGRIEQIRQCINAIHTKSSFTAIIGKRGVGKSSVALQMKRIAEGDDSLSKVLGLKKEMPRDRFDNIVHYIKCDSFISDISDLVKRVLFGDESNKSLFSLTKAGPTRLASFKKKAKTSGGFEFGAKLGAECEAEEEYDTYVSDDLIQQFRHLIGTIKRDNQKRKGLLIIIDEFDRIKDKKGFASLVKACSDEFVRFSIVGIANNIYNLVRDHESIARQLQIIQIPRMSKSELIEILHKAEKLIKHRITYMESVAIEIAEKSEGYPYFTHSLGKEAMLAAYRQGLKVVESEQLIDVYKQFSEGKLRTSYEDLYQNAVKHSEPRELLLKLFAEAEEEEIPTQEVYAVLKELGFDNPSQLMQVLTSGEGGTDVLVKVRDRCYRFSDPVFRVYVRLRNWKH